MQRRWRRSASLALLGATSAALATACAAGRTPGSPATSAASVPAPAEDDALLAADASTYTSFFLSGAVRQLGISSWIEGSWEMFGANVLDADSAAIIGIDPQRPVVLSSSIVDDGRLRELLADPHAPAKNAPFAVRLLMVVPVQDPGRAQAALDVLMREGVCARPRGDAARRARLLARLEAPNDRRTAEASNAAYLCMTDMAAIVVRVNAARRELRWTSAAGYGGVLTAAAAPVKPARELGDRLQREGFFSARIALYKAPADDARAATALGLIKSMAGVAGVDATMKDRMWQKGTSEVSAAMRLIDSPPVLFSGFLFADGVMSWMLTKEGREFFSPLPVPRTTTAKALKAAVAKTFKPGGAFMDMPRLCDEVHMAGSSAELPIRHMLWPHIIAFTAAHPSALPELATDFDDEGQVEIDVEGGRVRLRRRASDAQ